MIQSAHPFERASTVPRMLQLYAILVVTASVLFAGILQGQTSKQHEKNPYSMTVEALKGPGGTSLSVRIVSIDLDRFPLPTTLVSLMATMKDRRGKDVDKFKGMGLPLQDGKVTVNIADLESNDDIEVKVHCSPQGWHDENFREKITVCWRPDIKIIKADAPKEVAPNAPFDVEVVVKDSHGEVNSTASFTLYDGATPVATVTNVAIPRGKPATFVFKDITASTIGKHTYRITVSDVDPPDPDHSQDDFVFTLYVVAKPDLKVESVIAPEQVFSNTSFSVQAVIAETGGQVGAVALVKLSGAGNDHGATKTVTVPKGGSVNVVFEDVEARESGRMKLTVKVWSADDANGKDNSASCTVLVVRPPDLDIVKVSAPDDVVANIPFTIGATIREVDRETGATAVVRLYDGTSLLATSSQITVAKGSSVNVSFPGVTASGTGKKTYRLSIEESNPAESNTRNNSATVSVSVKTKPDLIVKGVVAPQQVLVNTPFFVQATIEEVLGQIGATAKVKLLEGSTILGSAMTATVASGGTATVDFPNIVVATPGAHTYNVQIFDVSPKEYDQTNNSFTFTVLVVVPPDLRVSNVVAPQEVAVNAPFSVVASIQEAVGSSSATGLVSLYEGATLIGSESNVNVAAGGTTSVTFHSIVASTAGSHAYTVKITNASPSESDVTNNEYSFTVVATAHPDLSVSGVTAPSEVIINTPFSVQATIVDLAAQIDATADVSLYQETNLLSTVSSVHVPSGGTVSVTFPAVTPTALGTHNYSIKIVNTVPTESALDNNEQALAVSVVGTPDLTVQGVTAPAEALENTTFDVVATIKELNGQVGATVVVSLYEGTTLLGSKPNVTVPVGGTVSVVFSAVSVSGAGEHTFTVKITGADPQESGGDNNNYSFSVTITQPMGFPAELYYFYQNQINWLRTTGYYNNLDSTFDEIEGLDVFANVPSATLPSSPLDEISLKIETTNGIFTEVSYAALTRTGGDATTDIYAGDIPDKNITFSLTIDRGSGSMVFSLHQENSYKVRVVQTSEASFSLPIGSPSATLGPSTEIRFSIVLRSGSSTWGGTSVLVVPELIQVTNNVQVVSSGSVEDGTAFKTITGFVKHVTSAPAVVIGSLKQPPADIAAEEGEEDASTTPVTYELGQNYPNPFNPTTNIAFSIAQPGAVSLRIYDMLGREVAILASGEFKAGTHRVQWNASGVPSGVYFYRMQSGNFKAQKKLLLLK